MVVILDTNTHMGIFHIQKMPTFCTPNFNLLSGFMLSKRPNYSFGLMKTEKSLGVIHNCGRISVVLKGGGSDEGGVTEKELEFKPSFDEYLKAMESVQTVREKRKQSKIQTRKIEENINLGVLEKSEMKITIKDNSSVANVGGLRRNDYVVSVEGGLDNNVERSKSVWLNARNKSGVSKGGVKKMGFIEKSNEGNAKELDFRSSRDDAKVEKKMGVEARIGRWTNNGVRETQRYDIEGGRTYAQSAPQRVRVDSVGKRGYRDNGDDELVTDRAAFRSLEEYNDIDDKPRVSRLDMEERIQKLAKSLNGADIDMPEWKFSRMMRSAKIRFADHSMLRVIQILGKYGNWRRVLQVIEWIQSRERFKSHKLRFIYTAALDALGKARRPVEALNLYHTMQQQMSTYPDLVAYHCIAVTLGQAGHMKELFDVIDSMQSSPKKKFETGVIGKWDPRLKPDIVVYNAVLNACVHRKKWEGAFWVLKQMKEEGQQPTTTTYGLIMEVMFACGKYSLVHDFYKKIHKSANALSYKVLVNTHWKEGNIDMAVRVVKEMEGRGIIGSGGLYYDLARGLCSVGRSQEALMLIDKICRVANRPLVVTYTGLIQTCLECGNIRDGANIFKHMHKFCSPNLVTCNIMLKAYLDHEMFEEAKVLFQKLVESGNHISSKSDYKDRVIPDNHTFNLMLDACALQQRWEDLEFTYRKMLQHEYHFNAKRHLRMVLDACRAGKTELLEITWKHLVEADRVPPPLLVKQMFFLKLKQEDYSGAFACVTNHPSCELPEFSKKSWLRFFKENSDKLEQGILVGLVHEISNIFARSDSSNLILENLNTACREFLRIHMKAVDFEQSLTF